MRITPVDPDDRITPWIVYRIVIPFVAIVFVVGLVALGWESWRCRRPAADRGYVTGTYSPPGRFEVGGVCICKGKRNPDGTVDAGARLVIDLR